jgi:gluconate 2-dehydrogenase gamma chain
VVTLMLNSSGSTIRHIEKSNSRPSDVETYRPEAFPPHIFLILECLCDLILPADERSGSARDAGVAPLLDYLSSQNDSYLERILGGIIWVDAACKEHFGASFLASAEQKRSELVRLIAYRKNGSQNPGLLPGIEFFAFLRREVLSAFFSSAIGFRDLDYRGNQYVTQFLGCPPLPIPIAGTGRPQQRKTSYGVNVSAPGLLPETRQ